MESVNSLQHASVIQRLLADLPVHRERLLGLQVGGAVSGGVSLQAVLQDGFALAGGQVVEEVLGSHLDKPGIEQMWF